METETPIERMELPSSLAERYVDLELVGRGGMGDVYRAMDRKLHRPVALKMVRTDLDDQLEMLRRFRREVRAMQRVSHPNLVSFLDLIQEEGRRVLIMEYVEGRTLEARLEEGPLSVDEASSVILDCADALQAIHEAGLLHRDVKPGNVMLGDDGLVRLMDFGLVRFEDAAQLTALTATGNFVGTARYLAPEVLLGMPPDARSDLYGLGLVLAECLTGEHPMAGVALPEILSGATKVRIDPPSSRVTGLDGDFDEILARAVALDREERFPSAGAFAEALRAWSAGAPLPSERPSDRLAPVSGSLVPPSEAIPPARGGVPRGARKAPDLPWRLALVTTLVAAGLLVLGIVVGKARHAPVSASMLHDLTVRLDGPDVRLRYDTTVPMVTAVDFDEEAPRCEVLGEGRGTRHEIRCTGLEEGRIHRFRIRYPDGQRSVPFVFATRSPASELRVELASPRRISLSWTTPTRTRSLVRAIDGDGRPLGELDVFISDEGREHLLRLDAEAPPPFLERELVVEGGERMRLVHRERIPFVAIFGRAWSRLPVLDAFAAQQVPEAYGLAKLPPPAWPLDEATRTVTVLLPAMSRAVDAFYGSRPSALEALRLHEVLDVMARICCWAPTRELRDALGKLATERNRFYGPRVIDERTWSENASRATWSHRPPTPILLVPQNFSSEYVKSLLHLVSGTVLHVPCLPRKVFRVELDEDAARLPHELGLKVGNFDPVNTLRVACNGHAVHVVGQGKRNFDFIPFSVQKQSRLDLRTLDEYEQHFPPTRFAITIPADFLRPGPNEIALDAWALESRSMFFPGMGSSYLRPLER